MAMYFGGKSANLKACLATGLGLIILGTSALVAAMGHLEPKIPPVAAEDKQAGEEKKPLQKVGSSNPLSGNAEAIEIGQRLYFTWCVQCHGVKADGRSRFGEYAGDLTKFWRGYKEFVQIVKNGRPGRQMPPWKEVLDDENVAKIGAYLETRAVEGANWK
jgi:mono/diheme cytochrome c family protein